MPAAVKGKYTELSHARYKQQKQAEEESKRQAYLKNFDLSKTGQAKAKIKSASGNMRKSLLGDFVQNFGTDAVKNDAELSKWFREAYNLGENDEIKL